MEPSRVNLSYILFLALLIFSIGVCFGSILVPKYFFANLHISTNATSTFYPPQVGRHVDDLKSSFYANHGKDLLSAWTHRASAHVCNGGTPVEVFHGADHTSQQRFMTPEKRSCVFRNLCWSGNNFVYFKDAAYPIPFEHSNSMGPIFEPPAPLLSYGQKFADDISRDWMRIAVEDGPIPESYKIANDTGVDNEPIVHVLVAASWLENIGHELADSVWPAFGTMMETRMLALDNQVVLFGTPDHAYGSHDCLSKRPSLNIAQYPAQTCFSWAVAGNGGRGLPSPPLPSLFSWSLMQDFVFARYGYQHAALSPATFQAEDFRIVVRYKIDRHSFTNYDALMSGLRCCYPGADVVLFNPENFTFSEEIRFLSSASVYITPGGGGSFTAPFLSRNAVVIIAAACWPGTVLACATPTPEGACCVQVERHVWSMWQYMHVFYYTYDGPIARMVRQESSGFEPLLWNYPVHIPSLVSLIDKGLHLRSGFVASERNCTFATSF